MNRSRQINCDLEGRYAVKRLSLTKMRSTVQDENLTHANKIQDDDTAFHSTASGVAPEIWYTQGG